jgi:tRNA A37 threonylcarbamoyladenosine modification protein TsaB
VGLAAALAWGKAFGRRVRGVSILEAMVTQALATTDWAFPIMDARRGEFFLGSFRHKPSDSPGGTIQDYEPADAGWLLKPESLRARVEEHLAHGESATCLARVNDHAAADLRANLPASLNWQPLEGVLLKSIAEIARKEEQSSCPDSNAKLDAYYLRRPDAEVNWKD